MKKQQTVQSAYHHKWNKLFMYMSESIPCNFIYNDEITTVL